MELNKRCYSPAFSARFTNNRPFREVVKYAVDNNCLRTLDSALNTIKKADLGEITILHGETAKGSIYSTFAQGKRSVPNSVSDAKTPAEASFDGILELSMLSKKFRSLFGVKEASQNINSERIMKEYTI